VTAKPRLHDACCCQGGASRGYADVGWDVDGSDIIPQPRYPYPFHLSDSIAYIKEHGHKYDAHAASFPCQWYTNCWQIQQNDHPDLISPGRDALNATGKPWVMENVPGAPLRNPVELCMCMFDDDPGTYRPRWFETGNGFTIPQPPHRPHTKRHTKMGRPPQPGEVMHVVGNFSGAAQARAAMGIDWMSRDGLREAIPPAYTQWIGLQLMQFVKQTKEIAA
jgi:DNA (cytosine-5)-methyltransferase 1